MARIRSIHPGLFTDEAFMTLSDAARITLIGLWVEADDQGVFEWKPLTLKARIRPVNTDDMATLLEEIASVDMCCVRDVDGKRYGYLRNFRKFQRPQKPNAIHPLPDEMATYVGLVRDHSITDNGKSPQMEDEGGRMEDEGGTEPNGSEDIPDSSDECRPALEAYNATAEQIGLPKAQKLTDTRRSRLKARLKDCGGLEGWEFALAKMRDSPFLRGENDRGWKADLDFLLTQSKFVKLMEGGYDQRSCEAGVQQRSGAGSRVSAELAALYASGH